MIIGGLSGLGTEEGVYSFSRTGSAFLPKGNNAWKSLTTPPTAKFYYSCPVQISRTELLVMGGHPTGTYGKQVWKLDITTGDWTQMKNMTTGRYGFGCSAYRKNGQTHYVLVAG